MSTNEPNSIPSPVLKNHARDFKPGDKIAGCYVLKNILFETAGTVVWLAHDDLLNREVSLHFVPDAVFENKKALEDLQAQVKLNRQLIHPHILRVYDLVEDVGCAAISMDHFEGTMLSTLQQQKPGHFFNASEARPWFADICQAMEDAHRATLLHRNLTPDSIFIRKNGAAIVMGFGINRVISDALSRAEPGQNAEPGMAFTSPQILDGENAAPSDDVYSFGAVAYAVLTGKPPFDEDNIVAQIRKNVPPPVSVRRSELKLVGEGIPAEWEKTIAASLEKHTDTRPANFQQVSRDMKLDRAAGGGASAPAKSAAAAGSAVAGETPASTSRKTGSSEKPRERTADKKREGAPGSPFAGTPSGDSGNGSHKGVGAGFIVALALGAVVLIGLIVLLSSGGKDGQKSAGEPMTSGVSEGTGPKFSEIEPAPLPEDTETAGQETPEIPGEESGVAAASATPAEQAAAAGEASPQASPADPLALMPDADAGTLNLEQLDQAVTSAQLVFEQLSQQKSALVTQSGEAKKVVDEKSRQVPAAEKGFEKAKATAKSEKEREQGLSDEAAAARKALEEKEKAVEEQKKKTAEAEAVLLQTEDSMKVIQEQVAAAEKQAADAAENLKKVETDLATVEVRKEKFTQAMNSALEKSAAAEAAEKQRKADEEKRLAAEAERTRLAREAEQADLEKKSADAQKAAEEAAQLAEQARKALEQAEKLRAAADEARIKAEQSRPAATPAPAAVPAGTPEASAPTVAPTSAAAVPAGQPPAKIDENSLGMRFVPVGDVLFSIWPTRVQDFAKFAASSKREEGRWSNPGFKQDGTHPVVNVSWLDSIAFCQWLTEKDQREGRLPGELTYRLPTDAEWSAAVGLKDEGGDTPEDRDMGVANVYPWGNQWPPPKGAGNYTGAETKSDVAIKGYDDGFVWTAPVGSFQPNPQGLYDMGGNVWEWVMDWWNSKQTAKVLRGASWYNGALKLSLLSSCRVHATPDSSTDNYGFRVVIAKIPRAKPN